MNCLKCNEPCVRDEVDIGMDYTVCPWRCNNCGWDQGEQEEIDMDDVEFYIKVSNNILRSRNIADRAEADKFLEIINKSKKGVNMGLTVETEIKIREIISKLEIKIELSQNGRRTMDKKENYYVCLDIDLLEKFLKASVDKLEKI